MLFSSVFPEITLFTFRLPEQDDSSEVEMRCRLRIGKRWADVDGHLIALWIPDATWRLSLWSEGKHLGTMYFSVSELTPRFTGFALLTSSLYDVLKMPKWFKCLMWITNLHLMDLSKHKKQIRGSYSEEAGPSGALQMLLR